MHIAFHLHFETPLPPCYGFCGDEGRGLQMRRVMGRGAAGATHFLCKWVFL